MKDLFICLTCKIMDWRDSHDWSIFIFKHRMHKCIKWQFKGWLFRYPDAFERVFREFLGWTINEKSDTLPTRLKKEAEYEDISEQVQTLREKVSDALSRLEQMDIE